jgi:hypothetical protein
MEALVLEALSTPLNKRRTFILLAACGALAVASAAVGISDNPPGLVLAFLSAIALVLALAHPWRTSKQFRYLFYASGLSFIVFAVLHNVFDVLSKTSGDSGSLQSLLNGAGAVFFLVAILLCPPGLFVGAVGAVGMFYRQRHSHPGAPLA